MAELLESNLREVARQEIHRIEQVAQKPLPAFSLNEAQRVKVIWTLSGTGTYSMPITQHVGDQFYLNKPWGHWSDRRRLNHAATVICHIASTLSNKKIDWQPELTYSKSEINRIQVIISKTGPFLVYNGIADQNHALKKASANQIFPVPLDKIFIPEAKIIRTLDQVKNLCLPTRLQSSKDDVLGVVTHAPHYTRVMRMFNLFKPIPNIKIKLFPLIINDQEGEKELTEMELNGVVDYADKGVSSQESYPYEL